MRTKSPKQSEASRANGSKSKGPKSPETKQKVRLNALKDGLFSKELVIESAGERREDFENIKAALWEFFQPASALEEMLVTDFVENWWRRERIRRSESAELRNRLETLQLRYELNLADEGEGLKVRFLTLVAQRQSAPTSKSQEDINEVTNELENVRTRLSSGSLGLQYLIDTMRAIEDEAASKGELSVVSEVLILACCGFASQPASYCIQINKINRRESQAAVRAKKSKEEAKSGMPSSQGMPIDETLSSEALNEEPLSEEAYERILKEQAAKLRQKKSKLGQNRRLILKPRVQACLPCQLAQPLDLWC